MNEIPTSQVLVRRLIEGDSLEDLTALLHRAYAQLANMGLRYWATHQTVEDTKKRVTTGECWVSELSGTIVGTILLIPPGTLDNLCDWYARPGIAVLSQFAVEPSLQRQGLGSCLLAKMEERASEIGAVEVAIDTAEPARHLVESYERRGYRFIGRTQWKHTNYRSVILSKVLRS